VINLCRGRLSNIEVLPRWPARSVRLDGATFARLCEAQAVLPEAMQIVLTRGYQPEGIGSHCVRHVSGSLFTVLYPSRRSERYAIFGHNGHATSGNHVDLSLRLNGVGLNLLPVGAFTPMSIVSLNKWRFYSQLRILSAALASAGFVVHDNATESLQIHCDLNTF
jgi:hypothetical protein